MEAIQEVDRLYLYMGERANESQSGSFEFDFVDAKYMADLKYCLDCDQQPIHSTTKTRKSRMTRYIEVIVLVKTESDPRLEPTEYHADRVMAACKRLGLNVELSVAEELIPADYDPPHSDL
jgi:hypothetical protein